MTSRFIALLPLACAAVIACGREQPVGLEPAGTQPPRVLGSVEMRPATFAMSPGDTLRLLVDVKDQFGSPLGRTGALVFASSEPAVARVSSEGVVTALRPGFTEISAIVTVGVRVRGASMTMTVVRPPSTELLLQYGSQGWQPAVAELTAGGLVRWFPGSWSPGAAHTTLYLFDDYRFVDSLDLSSGSASRRFHSPGTFRYCSGGCFDPPDAGIIYVR